MQGYANLVSLSHITPHDVRRFVSTPLAMGDIRRAQKAGGHTRIDTMARHDVLDALKIGLTDHRA